MYNMHLFEDIYKTV